MLQPDPQCGLVVQLIRGAACLLCARYFLHNQTVLFCLSAAQSLYSISELRLGGTSQVRSLYAFCSREIEGTLGADSSGVRRGWVGGRRTVQGLGSVMLENNKRVNASFAIVYKAIPGHDRTQG